MNDTLHSSSPPSQGWLFQRLRWGLLRNTLQVLYRDATLRLITIVLVSLIVWGAVFIVSAIGFLFLKINNIPFAGGLIGILFDLQFLSLAVLLIFSGGIILYASLFGSAETAFLLSTPLRADQVFAYKFQTAIGFSSYAFVLLGSPVLIAYGLAFGVPWYFYALLPFYFVGFVLLPGSVGALACLIIVNFLPRRPRQVLFAGCILSLLLLGGCVLRALRVARDPTAGEPLQQLLGQLTLLQNTFLPSHWMSEGLRSAARGELTNSVLFLALLWSNGLFLYVVTAWAAAHLYRRGYNRIATGGMLQRRPGGRWLDAILSSTLAFLDGQTRQLIIKDFRTFRRDPAQWAQMLIFAGLMFLYSLNTRRFYRADVGAPYQYGISLLNLCVTGLLMCAYTGRFVYPMLSLEGRKFWLLGLLPLSRDRLLWGKFAFAATGTVLVSELFVVVSDLLLGVSLAALLLHALTAAMLALGLSGLSVGLGAFMPNFQESDPSKIAVGFGGTLNLVTGLLFLVLIVALMTGPFQYFAVTGQEDRIFSSRARWLVGAGIVAGMLLGVAAITVPLRLGARALRRMEF